MHSGETLVNLKLRITTALRAMESTGVDIPSDSDQASDFVAKLDHRWSSLKTQLANDYIRGLRNQPQTLMEAYVLASNWKVVVTSTNGSTSTAFATSVSSKFKNLAKNDNGKSPTKNKDTTGGDKDGEGEKKIGENKTGCHLCGDNHYMKDCPYRNEAKKVIEQMRANTVSQPVPTQTSPQATRRTHITTTSSSQFTTVTFMSSDKAEHQWIRERILFDPQAQTSSFCNSDYLTDIHDREAPIKYSGQVSGTDVATEQGLFMNMITVDYNPQFSTNIISGAEMRHVYGYHWEYDSILDEFRLYIGDKQLTFKMENMLYTMDPTNDYDIVKTYSTMMTKQQERKAQEAQELIKRLGYPSPQRLITAIREGAIINTDVSPEDIRRSDAIFGHPYPYLAGKAVWRDPDLPVSIRANLLPESDLQGHVDIMYLMNKKIIALVTVFKPIDLVITTLMPSVGKEAKKQAFTDQLAIIRLLVSPSETYMVMLEMDMRPVFKRYKAQRLSQNHLDVTREW